MMRSIDVFYLYIILLYIGGLIVRIKKLEPTDDNEVIAMIIGYIVFVLLPSIFIIYYFID
jgi:hypothetical protein